ncbi:hypothetical protein Poli38472_009522 [Pythium oligandrum]|uniref:Sulfatase N-terminal domain-containing protein n=1 Tax=Pythium oligandrum TaxID=41045 RepID=A0A8K1CFD9_PYTOL|nr:hypothetical protein Poli38472_009522 [Pythium oligandrum]|eukprot:TMW62029.1 hypothetical protein Poli38472_009522 [Pythium oligandrum]
MLYRRTTGFKGPLAFDVTVDQAKLPNVLVLVVKSFRFWDSLYMNENSTISEAMKQHHLSVTPNFDRWAKRGVAFNNMWSSWQTSRLLESILFGQIPLDSVTETGTTYGREDTKLSGMPQFFKQKGYETVFTTGCTIKYDQWDRFLPSHGFDTVLGEREIRALAEKEFGISPSDWYNL